MSTETIQSTLLSAAISVAATWFFAWLYYKRAGDDLRTKAGRLQRTVNVLGDAMEQEGWVKLLRDDRGNIIGLKFIRGTGDVGIGGPTLESAGTVGPPPAELTAPKAAPWPARWQGRLAVVVMLLLALLAAAGWLRS